MWTLFSASEACVRAEKNDGDREECLRCLREDEEELMSADEGIGEGGTGTPAGMAGRDDKGAGLGSGRARRVGDPGGEDLVKDSEVGVGKDLVVNENETPVEVLEV